MCCNGDLSEQEDEVHCFDALSDFCRFMNAFMLRVWVMLGKSTCPSLVVSVVGTSVLFTKTVGKLRFGDARRSPLNHASHVMKTAENFFVQVFVLSIDV